MLTLRLMWEINPPAIYSRQLGQSGPTRPQLTNPSQLYLWGLHPPVPWQMLFLDCEESMGQPGCPCRRGTELSPTDCIHGNHGLKGRKQTGKRDCHSQQAGFEWDHLCTWPWIGKSTIWNCWLCFSKVNTWSRHKFSNSSSWSRLITDTSREGE